MTARVGLLRHWAQIETRQSAEDGTNNASISYTPVTQTRCHIAPAAGSQMIRRRGSDQSRTPTHVVEFRTVPDMANGIYIKVLNGPYKDLRLKIDDQSLSRLGRRIFLGAYVIGDDDEFVQPVTPTLPDII